MRERKSSILTLVAIMFIALCVGPPPASAELDIDEIRTAAGQGDADAQYLLGVSYAEGQGVTEDEIKAYAWSSLAAAHGEEIAAHYRDNIATQLSPRKLQKAQAMAAEFQDEIDKQIKQPPSLRFWSSSPPAVVTNTELSSWLQRIKPAAGGN